ncbi:MAG: ABC transporter substrate-binding protein [Gammaproteobacteria bacterium]
MIRFFLTKFLFVLSFSSFLYSEKIPEIHEFIDKNAQYFLTVIKEEGSTYDNEPEKFKTRLKNIWEPMVDVGLVSRLILSKAYAGATPAQIVAFEKQTKKLLLDTYVTTLLEFEDYTLETNDEIKINKRTYEVSVKFLSSSDSFITKFSVYKNKLGEYKIINIIIDGINLGLTFRNQFQDNLANNNMDLDKAIETWEPLYIN